MTSLQVAGFSASILIGVSLGLIGGGGSILTLPVLVYMLGLSPVISTAYSLFIVGTTSLVGSVSFMRQKLVNYKAGIVFAIPSFIAVFLTRRYLVPAIPDSLFSIGGFELTKNIAIMLFFALVMLAASYSMIRNQKKEPEQEPGELRFNYPIIGLEGLAVGVLTGLVGAGGEVAVADVAGRHRVAEAAAGRCGRRKQRFVDLGEGAGRRVVAGVAAGR